VDGRYYGGIIPLNVASPGICSPDVAGDTGATTCVTVTMPS
jgi:hypothetical protein